MAVPGKAENMMNKRWWFHGILRILAAGILAGLAASPSAPASAQSGITLSGGSVSGPINAQESAIYAEMVIESAFDGSTGTYLLNGSVNKNRSAGNFSGVYDPATGQVSGQYFLSLTPSSDAEGAETYTLYGSFSGVIGGSSVTLSLSGSIKYDKWNYAVDKDGNPVYRWFLGNDQNGKAKYEYYLEHTETNPDSRQAAFEVSGDIPQGTSPGGDPAAGPEGAPAAGEACSPQPRGLDPAKPGDVISPGADYVDAGGKSVGIIQERWFINDINTSSAAWDGKQVTVELQYTCLDNKGYSRTYTIPAYQESPAGLPTGQAAGGGTTPAPSGGPAGSGPRPGRPCGRCAYPGSRLQPAQTCPGCSYDRADTGQP